MPLGVWLSNLIAPSSRENYHLIYLIAILIMFISFLLLEWLVRRESAVNYEGIDEEMQLARSVQQNMLPKPTDFPQG
ncbi:MAG: hypothetical protein K6T83_00545 [Alicyclobacillus sp.]|nr:hypothetical protein [Alicyclobacillus sp.]